jgi:hypothetical protein
MATADQVKALVRSHADGDDGHFYAVAMQVAARAAKAGQSRFASGHTVYARTALRRVLSKHR